MISPLTFKYLDLKPLAGRGGVLRFFMLIHGMDFQETLIPMKEWGAAKAKMLESNENPCGSVPVLMVNDDDTIPELSQHIALCRYLYRKSGASGASTLTALEELTQDMVADEYQGFRSAWAGAAFSDEAAKDTYKKETLPKMLTKFNALYAKYATTTPFLTAKVPLWADTALAGLIYDNISTGLLTTDNLKEYAKLDALYEGFTALPAVSKWMAEVKP